MRFRFLFLPGRHFHFGKQLTRLSGLALSLSLQYLTDSHYLALQTSEKIKISLQSGTVVMKADLFT